MAAERTHRQQKQQQQRQATTYRSRQHKAAHVAGAAIGVLIAGRLILRIFKRSSPEKPRELKFVFNLKPSQIIKLAEELILRSQKVYDSIAAVPLEKVTYANVIAPLALLEAEEFPLMQSCKFPRIVSTSKEDRQASFDAEKMLDAHKIKCSMRHDVYQAVKAASQKKGLEPEAQRYVGRLVRDFERQGLNLRSEVREELERLKTRIQELCTVFQNNVNEDDSSLFFSVEELAGMHPDFVKSLDVGEAGKLKLSLKPCHYLPIMEQCKVGSTRSSVTTARYQRCMKENVPILEKVLELRQKLALLLRCKNWADYVLDVRMARNPDKVKNFHDQMLQHIIPSAERELKLLQDLKKEEEGDAVIGLEDVIYYIQKAEGRLLKLDLSELSHYFPIEVVTSGLFRIYEHLLGLKFQEDEAKYVWYEDVRQFSVFDSVDGQLLGFFYLDLYAREGKYNHACVVPLQPGCDMGNKKQQLPVAALLMSVAKSTCETPTLLRHSDLVTYFHEFGHVMHHLCSCVTFAKFSGLQVETDFMEVPSQMLENWCYEKESLKLMSCSYKDPKVPVPDDICNLLQEKRKSFSGLRALRNNIFMGMFDQILHTEGKVDTESIVRRLYPEVVLGMPMPERTNLAASTLHFLSGGYDAVCYSHLWSEVFAADMFEAKFKGNILNNICGKEFRKKVLSPGASKDAIQILREFLGRDPLIDAYFRMNGLTDE